MANSSSKVLTLATAFALTLIAGLPKPISANAALLPPQGQQDGQNNQQNDGNKQSENQDLNDDRQEGPNDNHQEGLNDDRQEALDRNQEGDVQEMNGTQLDANSHESTIDEDRVQDQQQDEHEDSPTSPNGI
jgi:hypothetical protein